MTEHDNGRGLAVAAAALPLAVAVLLVLLLAGADSRNDQCGRAGGVAGPITTRVGDLSDRQLRLARDGVVIGRQRGMGENVILAELAAQAAESSFANLSNPNVPESAAYPADGEGHDHDSVGPHQMRATVWAATYGGVAGLMDPVVQINWFYDQAAKMPGAQQMPPGALAQQIEGSAHPDRYDQFVPLARELFAAFAGTQPGAANPRGDGRAAGCPAPGIPAPAPADEFGTAVLAAAQRWLGTDYVWGGGDANGPAGGGFDCSGLTLYAVYQASGGRISLPHYTQAQQDDARGQHVPLDQLRPGDLVYFTKKGDVDSHHVGIYAGDGQILNAPQSGDVVRYTPLSAWADEEMSARRFEAPNAAAAERGNRAAAAPPVAPASAPMPSRATTDRSS